MTKIKELIDDFKFTVGGLGITEIPLSGLKADSFSVPIAPWNSVILPFCY